MRAYILVTLLLVLATIGVAITPQTGTVTCPASGNVALSTKNLRVPSYSIQALVANTGTVYVGGTTVSSSSANGAYLLAGMALSGAPQSNTSAYDLGNLYIACTDTTGHDKIVWLAQ